MPSSNAHTPDSLTTDALEIWRAGVEAVKPENLFRSKVDWEADVLRLGGLEIDLTGVRRLVVVGAGKAAATMLVALQQHVLERVQRRFPQLEICGWLNCPADTLDLVDRETLAGIHLHPARPAGLNAPTEQAVEGTQEILNLVSECGPDDLVINLLSGGGSALLVAPAVGVRLKDKQAVARLVSAAGGDIEQLNCVRSVLSQVKAGGLARHCRAGRLLTLVISDVLGDPLSAIASGPTWLQKPPSPPAALDVLRQLELDAHPDLTAIVAHLRQASSAGPPSYANPSAETTDSNPSRSNPRVEHLILGNNADAVDAAGVRAVELGYRYVMQAGTGTEGDVFQVADRMAGGIRQMWQTRGIDCWITGGEPTVRLPETDPGKGGRNQQLAVAVLQRLVSLGWPGSIARESVFVSGGTDGEDGPTDAAGGYVDRHVFQQILRLGLDYAAALQRADTYPLLKAAGGLLHTGPTGTNVCDLRVALVR